MDDRRFDSLTKLLASGASRRAVIRSLLGLGGAAVVAESADARTARTRPTIPPPKPPACPLPKQMCGGVCCDGGMCKDGHCCTHTTDVWCGNACCDAGLCTDAGQCCAAGHKVCGSVCCPSTTACAIDGNQDICCDPATAFPCGLECCSDEFQCCDRECCGEDHLCLARVFGEQPGIEEEVCCPASKTCDGRCCDGDCFFDPGSDPFIPLPPLPTRTCCPAGDDTTFCPGIGDFAPFGACCSGETRCCHDDAGRPICISDTQCCTTDDCIDSDDICCDGACVEVECCTSGDCEECEFCDGGSCFPCSGEGGGVCCDGVCHVESECCNDLDCVENFANVDPGCAICVNGQCDILGDASGGPECVFEENTTGVCCHGACIDDADSCADCMSYGESCFGALPCCDSLSCDVLAGFTCLRRCQSCDQNGENCQPAADGSFCLLDSFESGTCCGGVCSETACPTTTTSTTSTTTTTTTTSTTTTSTTTTTTTPTTTTVPPPCVDTLGESCATAPCCESSELMCHPTLLICAQCVDSNDCTGGDVCCNSTCQDIECCDAGDCVDTGLWDENCVACTLQNTCTTSGLLFSSCGVTSGICDQDGQCVECLPDLHPCDDLAPNQCCVNQGLQCVNSVCTLQ